MVANRSTWRVGVLLALSLTAAAVTGCSSGSSSTSSTSPSTGPAATTAAGAGADTGVPVPPPDLLAALAGAGVGVVHDAAGPSGTRLVRVDGPEAVVLSAWQVDVLAAEVASGSGLAAAELDAMVPMPEVAPMSAVLAGWMSSGIDDAATGAAALMGDPDWSTYPDLRYPMAVVMMFLADFVRHADGSVEAPATTAAQGGPARAAHVSAVDPHCGNISAIVEDLLTKIFGKLQLDAGKVAAYVGGKVPAWGGVVLGTAAGFLASFWNHTLGLAQKALQQVVDTVTAPVVDAVRMALGGLSLTVTVASYLKPWTMAMKASPSNLVLGEQARRGSVNASVDPKAVISEWPDFLVGCATAYGVQLPALSSKGMPVVWSVTTTDQLLTLTNPAAPADTTKLDDQLATTAEFESATEAADLADGELEYRLVWFRTNAQRTEVEQLRQLAVNLAAQELPVVLRGLAQPVLDGLSNQVADRVRDIVGVKGATYVAVGRHLEPKCGKGIPAGRYTTTFPVAWEQHATIGVQGRTLPSVETYSGTAALDITSDGTTVTGTVTFTGTNTGETAGFFGSSGQPFTLAVSGTVTAPQVTFTLPASAPPPLGGKQLVGGLHVTKVTCSQITGDAVEMMRDLALQQPALAPAGTSIRIDSFTGTGTWTAPRA